VYNHTRHTHDTTTHFENRVFRLNYGSPRSWARPSSAQLRDEMLLVFRPAKSFSQANYTLVGLSTVSVSPVVASRWKVRGHGQHTRARSIAEVAVSTVANLFSSLPLFSSLLFSSYVYVHLS
jgi:hypothetical protein